jgi:hypothetical protein
VSHKSKPVAKVKKISACPGWIGLSDDRTNFVYLPDRAAIVRKIFELAIGGLGSYAIANLLDKQGIPPFGPSPTWDHTNIDSMLRNRATIGEHQPKSYAGGNSKGIPTGLPVSNYYPQVIDEDTFKRAQVVRRQNLSTGRGRKGNNFANLFNELTTCAYCGSEVRYHRHGQYKSMMCAKVQDENACTRTAWSYLDFETNVLQFLAHPALPLSLSETEQIVLRGIVENIRRLCEEDVFAARYSIALELRKAVSELKISSAGVDPYKRRSDAQVRRDLTGRFFDIRLWDGAPLRCIAIT